MQEILCNPDEQGRPLRRVRNSKEAFRRPALQFYDHARLLSILLIMNHYRKSLLLKPPSTR